MEYPIIEEMLTPTLEEITKKREYKTAYLLIATLANMFATNEEKIIELLTGYLWDEEEAEHIKRSASHALPLCHFCGKELNDNFLRCDQCQYAG